MLGMKNHFNISGSIEICEVDIAGVTCTCSRIILYRHILYIQVTAYYNSDENDYNGHVSEAISSLLVCYYRTRTVPVSFMGC